MLFRSPYLEHMGAVVEPTTTGYQINTVATVSAQSLMEMDVLTPFVFINANTFFIKQLPVQTLVCNEVVYVPAAFMHCLWEVVEKPPLYMVNERPYEEAQYVCIDETSFINQSGYTLQMQVLVLFWNGTACEEQQLTTTLLPQGILAKTTLLEGIQPTLQPIEIGRAHV